MKTLKIRMFFGTKVVPYRFDINRPPKQPNKNWLEELEKYDFR